MTERFLKRNMASIIILCSNDSGAVHQKLHLSERNQFEKTATAVQDQVVKSL